MKKTNLCSLVLLPFLFFSCKTPPIQKVLPTINNNVVYTTPQKTIRIYFAQFYDEQGKVFNGDGTVIILPDDKVMVIDGFVVESADQYVEFIKSLNISKIDYLIGTHYHGDHIGSFPKIIQNFEIGTLYTNGAPIMNDATKALDKITEEKELTQNVLKKGDHLDLCNDCYIDIFWPDLTEQDKYNAMYNPGRTEKLINNTSLVTKLTYKDFSIIFPGDIYHSVEKHLVEEYSDQLKATILKAAHHGEWYTANYPLFVQTVSPDYGVIQDNRYITSRISNIYKKAGSKILYRLTPGYMLIESNGIDYNISETSYTN